MNPYANKKITVRQFQILIILGLIGDAILIMPTITASSARQDAWLSMLVAYAVGMLIGVFFALIANRIRQSESLIAASREVLGPWGGGFVGLLLVFNFFMCALSLLSEMSQFMTTQLMTETPVNAIIFVFLAVVILAFRYGVEVFARMGELLFPAFLVLFAFLVVFLLPQAEGDRLMPVASEGVLPILNGSVMAISITFMEMVVLLALAPHVSGSRGLTKPILSSFAIGGLLLSIVVLLCVMVLGPNLMETKLYPTFVLAQKLTIGNFLERMEAIIAFMWIITVFYKTLLLYYAAVAGIAQPLKLKENVMLTIPMAMIMMVFTVTSTPSITEYSYLLERYYPWFDLTFCLLVPSLLLAGLLVKKKHGGNADSKP
ncbi:GerAB/ArcD/ProY family transporter [Paenibacillus soyae]|uniref:Endospore germination permease n=1 Tax=Paenibacillus soyae TaxID=2969249 RepID=A0A9X2SCD1_9BACL|nr:endospore germination permease [Paenibacillus soyae]MCR2805912.1 endospore germination permease [Paenibacillus soyae]